MTIGASRQTDLSHGSTAPAARRPRALHAAPPATPLRNRISRSPLSRRDRRPDSGNLLERYRSLAISSGLSGWPPLTRAQKVDWLRSMERAQISCTWLCISGERLPNTGPVS